MAWYGGGRREVGVTTGTGHWYKAGEGLVPIAWVFVKDRTGTHRDEYFFSTDTAMTAAAMIEAYAGRWNLETTFQEARCLLGLESTRGWCRRTVLRAAPCLFGLYTVVALLYRGVARVEAIGPGGVAGQGGRDVLRCPDLGASLAVAGMGFSTGGRERACGSTPRVTAQGLVLCLGPGGVDPGILHQSSLQAIRE